jgi:hypothetical protein
MLIVLVTACGQSSADIDIRVVGGIPRQGVIRSLNDDGTLTLAAGGPIAAGDWYSLRRRSGVLPPWPIASQIELLLGDRIGGTVAGADGDAIRWKLSVPGKEQVIRIPISAARVIWLNRRPDEEPSWLAGPRKRDVIQARNGSNYFGSLLDLDMTKNRLRYQADGKDQEVNLTRIAAIGFNTELSRLRRPKGHYYRLTIADGTRLHVATVSFDGSIWTARTVHREIIRIPDKEVVSVDIEQGRSAWLSELKPIEYLYHSFDGEQQQWIPDRCVCGDAVRLMLPSGESTFDRGVGLHSECSIAYSLAGKYRRFEALAGLDSRTGIKGDAVLAVFVDGKECELRSAGRLTFAGGTIELNIDVTGAKILKIVVRRGNGGSVHDHVNLAEARLVP